MSTHRCEHGNVIDDNSGQGPFRCFECRPLTSIDVLVDVAASFRRLADVAQANDDQTDSKWADFAIELREEADILSGLVSEEDS